MAIIYDRVVLAKVESTKGTDSSPVVGSNAIRVKSVAVSVTTNAIDRQVVKQTMGNMPHLIGKQSLKADIVVEIRGSGALGTAPEVSPLLQACRLAETINAGVSVVYAPTTLAASEKSATIHIYKDGLKWVMVGAVGTVKIDASADGVILATFSLQSKYTAPTAVSAPSGSVFQSTQPLVMGTTTVMNDGAAIKVGQFGVDLGNDVQQHYLVGVDEFTVANRNPSMTITKDSVNTAAEWTALTAGSSVNFTSTFGTTSTNKVTIAAPVMARKTITYGERAERDTLALTYGLYESTSDDQLSLTFI